MRKAETEAATAPAPRPNVAIGSMVVAACVAAGFDQLFIRVRIPGIGWCLWILTTLLSFGGGGYATGRVARVSRGLAAACIAGSAAAYAAQGAYTLMNTGAQLHFTQALPAVLQSLVLALIGGFSGLRRGVLERVRR